MSDTKPILIKDIKLDSIHTGPGAADHRMCIFTDQEEKRFFWAVWIEYIDESSIEEIPHSQFMLHLHQLMEHHQREDRRLLSAYGHFRVKQAYEKDQHYE